MINPLELLALEPEPGTPEGSTDGRERCELLIARRGDRLYGVFAVESEGIVEWKEPTPLPKAAPAVLGVVCVRGRMFTVLDPALLETGGSTGLPTAFIILVKGADQLALGVERVSSIAEIFVDEIELEPDGNGPVMGVWKDDSQTVTILNTDSIFAAACAARA
jgi:chemotaxis signal transduction protein